MSDEENHRIDADKSEPPVPLRYEHPAHESVAGAIISLVAGMVAGCLLSGAAGVMAYTVVGYSYRTGMGPHRWLAVYFFWATAAACVAGLVVWGRKHRRRFLLGLL